LQPLGWKNFSELSRKTKLPVYALGGLSKEDLSVAEKNGAYGIGRISGF
jgi:8-oxo-dGTP diphosphatase